MHVFAVSADAHAGSVPGQLAFVKADGQTFMREHFPVDAAIVSRALVQLPNDQGLIIFAENGQVWPFSFSMAQKVVDLFAPRYSHTRHLAKLPARDQANFFEISLQKALEVEPDLRHIFASAKFAC